MLFLVNSILHLILLKGNASWLKSAKNFVSDRFSKTSHKAFIRLLKANVE